MTSEPPGKPEPDLVDFARDVEDVVNRAVLLDGRFRIPLTPIRFGWDPIVGIIPFFGDLAMSVIAYGLVKKAARLGCRRSVIGRMVVNVIIDFLIGMVPFMGPIVDIFFRANLRNAKLLIDELQRQKLTASPPPALSGNDARWPRRP